MNLDVLRAHVEVLDSSPLEVGDFSLHLQRFLNDLWRLVLASALHRENGLVNKPSLLIVKFKELAILSGSFAKGDKSLKQVLMPIQFLFKLFEAV